MGVSLNPASILSGQGIDVATLVTQILSDKAGEISVWQQEQLTLQEQASALNAINNDLSSLASAVQPLSDPLGPLAALTATSSNPGILTASAQASATAGTHQIVVSSLASAGTLYTNSVTNGSTSILPSGVTTGDLQIQVGGSSGTVHDIAITQGSNDTLTTLANYVNSQNIGVTASVITDANGARLALFSQSTGSTGALAIVNNTTSLAFNPPAGGTNASLTIDGIPYSSATNTVTGAIPGVTLNLASSDPSTPVQITVGADTQAATQAINTFVSAYNQVITDINQQFTVTPGTNAEGPLGSDSSLRQLQSSLLQDVTYSVSGNSGDINLASLGINSNDDGTLTVDASQLSSSLATNPAAVQAFFQNSSQTAFANNFSTDLTNLTDPTEGPLNVDLTQNSSQLQAVGKDISNFEAQLTAEQTALTAEYSAVNASLQAYPLLLQQVTETLGTLGTGSSGSNSTSPTLTSGL